MKRSWATYDDGLFIHGFIRSHGKLTAFDYPGASNTYASRIDDLGRIVGFYQVGGFSGGRGYELVDGNFTAIDVPGASATYASGINAAGDICGSFLDSSGQCVDLFYTTEAFKRSTIPIP